MGNLTNLIAFLSALSLATERITEVVKGLPFLSRWLAVQKRNGSTAEEFRKACIHIIAIATGTALAYLTKDQLSTALGMHYSGFWPSLLFGAMASGGSGMWNSALDIMREINKQKQFVTDQMTKGQPVAANQ